MSEMPNVEPGARLIDETGHVFVLGADDAWTCVCDDHRIGYDWATVVADASGAYRLLPADGKA